MVDTNGAGDWKLPLNRFILSERGIFMGEIYTVIYRDKDLTVNTALGKLTIDDILTRLSH